MNESEAVTTEDVANKSSRRLKIALSCLGVFFLFCCVPCGGFGAFITSLGNRVVSIDEFGFPDPATVEDPVMRRIAVSRAEKQVFGNDCMAVSYAFFASLEQEPEEDREIVRDELRRLHSSLATEPMLAVCNAMYRMECDASIFANFRATVVMLGEEAYGLASTNPDTLGMRLPVGAACTPFVDELEIHATETIEPMDVEKVRRLLPRTCHRFVCSPDDLF